MSPYKVKETPCHYLRVRVLRGRNITLGVRDLLDTPDPYLILDVESSPRGKKHTKTKTNDPNPIWNEEFKFLINLEHDTLLLEICLMESNAKPLNDQLVAKASFDICRIRQKMDVVHQETIEFQGHGQVDMEFRLKVCEDPSILRDSQYLSDDEKTFLEARKRRVMDGMRRLLGEGHGPRNVDEVPTICVIGSGGGFRAMIGFAGVLKALVETGVLDCVSYASGVSGSSWLLSTLYSHPEWPNNLDMTEFLNELMTNTGTHPMHRFLNPSTMKQVFPYLWDRTKHRKHVNLTDFFGWLIGKILIPGRMDSKLSCQREKVEDGKAPMPLYSCIHVRDNECAKSYHEWVEFSPYEVGRPKYGTFIDSSLFGSKVYMGRLVKKCEEQPLHFLQGIWGSAYSTLDIIKRNATPEMQQQSERKPTSGFFNRFFQAVWERLILHVLRYLSTTRFGRAAVMHNFMRELSIEQCSCSPCSHSSSPAAAKTKDVFLFDKIKNIQMVDAGLGFNSPYPLVLRPQREVDVILSFEFSNRHKDNNQPFEELLQAKNWADQNRLPFPPIDLTEYDEERDGMKELFVFTDPKNPRCPVVLHFVLINKTFRHYSQPGIPRNTKEERDFANFDIFDDPENPYSTFNFCYTDKSFQRLAKLTEFNTRLHLNDIKKVIRESVLSKRNYSNGANENGREETESTLNTLNERLERSNPGPITQSFVSDPQSMPPASCTCADEYDLRTSTADTDIPGERSFILLFFFSFLLCVLSFLFNDYDYYFLVLAFATVCLLLLLPIYRLTR